MRFKPHPIIPELLALLAKHKAAIGYTPDDDGIHLYVECEQSSMIIGREVFVGWMAPDDADLRDAAAGCVECNTQTGK